MVLTFKSLKGIIFLKELFCLGFWIFMFIMCIFIPAIMLLFGIIFEKRAPEKINPLFGYRTRRSMQNKDTWEFAHKCIGKIWKWAGTLLIPLSLIPLLFVMGRDKNTVGTVGTVIVWVQLAVLILSIIPVEAALKKKFDND